MKKFCILALGLLVCGLWGSFRRAQWQARGETLVEDAYYGDLVAVKNDVEAGAPLHFYFYFDEPERQYTAQTFNALHAAASSGNGKVVFYLLEQGMEVDARTPAGWTPLFVAARDGNAGVAKFLISRGADVNAQTDWGATPLTMAATQPYANEQDRISLLEYMLRKGADPLLADAYGHTPLYYAQAVGNPAVIDLLQSATAP